MNSILYFHNDLHHIFKNIEKEENNVLNKAWNDFSEILDEIQKYTFEYSKNMNSIAKEIMTKYLQYTDVYISDIFCSRQMLYNGFILQASIVLRPAMELSIILSILIAMQKFDKWCNGERIKIVIRVNPKKITKTIDECTYGNLLSAYEIIIAETKKAKRDFPILFENITSDIILNHRSFKSDFNIDKFIHRNYELIKTQKDIIRDYIQSKKNSTESEFSERITPLYQDIYKQQIICLIRTILVLYYDSILITGTEKKDGDIPYINFLQKLMDSTILKIEVFEKYFRIIQK